MSKNPKALTRQQLLSMAEKIGELSAMAHLAEIGMAGKLLDKAYETIQLELGLIGEMATEQAYDEAIILPEAQNGRTSSRRG
jgi:hypothetical protein